MSLKHRQIIWHLVIVLCVLFLPSLFYLPGSVQYTRFFKSYHEPVLFSRYLALLIYAYCNYYVLVPRLYLQNKHLLYSTLVLVFMLMILILPEWYVQLSVELRPPPGMPGHPPPPPFSWEVNNLALFFLIVTLAGIVVKKRNLLQQYMQQNEETLRLLEKNKEEMAIGIPEPQESSMTVTVDYGLTRIEFSDILFVKSMDNYVQFFLKEKKSLLVRMTLKEVNEKLPVEQFVRVHKSYIVALTAIEQLRNKTIGIGEYKIPLGPSFEKSFLSIFENKR